jgi:CDP-diacylglycerol--serine O-phosphatidyltransferase
VKKIRITSSVAPNLLTLGNIFSGFAAIIYLSQNNFKIATIYIVMAAIFDMLDGIVARLLKATSEIGAELDSLCDVVSFGIAPSFMLYQAYFHQFNQIGIIFSALPAIAGALRLARFNAQLTPFDDKLYFQGLPIPGGALTIISFVVFYLNTNYFGDFYTKILAFFVALVVPLSMISTIKFDNLPHQSVKIKTKPFVFISIIIAIVVGFATKGYSVFPTMLIYILYSNIKALYLKIKIYQQS